MNSKNEVDAFTQHIMGNIDQDVFKTLNIVQLEALRQAISAAAPFKKHPIDLRFTLPMYFSRLYVVFLVGRDKRGHVRKAEQRRREQAKGVSLVMTVWITLLVALPIIFMILYFAKSAMGIDLFPDKHLGDWF